MKPRGKQEPQFALILPFPSEPGVAVELQELCETYMKGGEYQVPLETVAPCSQCGEQPNCYFQHENWGARGLGNWREAGAGSWGQPRGGARVREIFQTAGQTEVSAVVRCQVGVSSLCVCVPLYLYVYETSNHFSGCFFKVRACVVFFPART